MGTRQALYIKVADRLREAIRSQHLPIGAVLLEGHIADLLKTTRAPVRQALQALEEEGLVCRFDGRGYLAGAADDQDEEQPRIALLPSMLGGGEAFVSEVRNSMLWEDIYNRVEHDLILLSIFGRHRINEVEMARHYGVGRAAARDALLRLEALGVLEKDARQRWSVIPLDKNRIQNLYELRWLLEPVALRAAVPKIPQSVIAPMLAALEKARKSPRSLSRPDMDRLEDDLHRQFYQYGDNKDVLQVLQRTRTTLILSKYEFQLETKLPRYSLFISEHLEILQCVTAGDVETAAQSLRTHLEIACKKIFKRLDGIRAGTTPPEFKYSGSSTV